MYIVAGLGNPGLKYKKTPHNAGFMAVDALAKQLGIRFRKKKFQANLAEGMLGGEKVLLLKPLTYMNKSGEAIREALSYYGVDSRNLIVIYDDKDLALGKLRIRAKGTGGSHNGMKSIITQLKTEDFYRIRFGIGAPENGMRLMNYVLHKLSKQELIEYNRMAELAAEAAQVLIQEGLEKAQQQYSSKR
ncbi:MAG: aminoacyl-tRNA hydrolase [Christensenellaceae bacterium]|jgi:PTH1 family peptidyl-tRNA hydrolase